MGVGAEDYIDKMLVQKYQEERVDNHDNMESMVDPNKIVFEAELQHESYGMKVVAKIEDGKIFMSNVEAGTARVPSVSMMKVIEAQSKVKANSYIKLNDLLDAAGFEFVEDEPDIDFTQMSKNDLIKLVE